MTDHHGKWSVSITALLGVGLALLMQAGVAIWWAASLDARTARLEDEHIAQRDVRERLARIEQILDNLQKQVSRLKER